MFFRALSRKRFGTAQKRLPDLCYQSMLGQNIHLFYVPRWRMISIQNIFPNMEDDIYPNRVKHPSRLRTAIPLSSHYVNRTLLTGNARPLASGRPTTPGKDLSFPSGPGGMLRDPGRHFPGRHARIDTDRSAIRTRWTCDAASVSSFGVP